MFIFKKSAENEDAVNRLIHQSTHNRLKDVVEIRRRGDYIPNYSKPNGVVTTCERPGDCPNNLEDWINKIHLENREDVNKKASDKIKEAHRSEFFQTVAGEYIMKKMLRVI